MKIHEDFSLKACNTFGIDVKCKALVEVESIDDLRAALGWPQYRDLPKLILGGGSNVLFTGDYPGVIIKMAIRGIEKVKEDERHVWLRAGAGEVWHKLVEHCLAHELAGIENLSLIPGCVGAAPMQNIGAYGVELESVFDQLEALHLDSGELRVFYKKDCRFGYRDSIFKNKSKGQYAIVAVTLRLNKQPVFNTSYGVIELTLQEMGVQELSIRAVSEAVIRIRRSKLPDPAETGNAGSFFKNPEISEARFQALKSQYPNLPAYPLPDGKVKVPAGWLIEQCGWKGTREGDAGVHERQALVLVNFGGAKGSQLCELACRIRQSVLDRFGIELTPEVNIVA